MEFVILDYSNIYYKTKQKSVVPFQRGGKFVQIRNKDTEYLIFSPQGFSSYHADIVQRFCVSKKINGFYDTGHYKYEIHNPDWIVVGGGKWMINEKDKTLHLYDESGAYGRFDARGLEERIQKDSIYLLHYTVHID